MTSTHKKIFKNSFYYMFASFLPLSVKIILLPVFSYYLTPEDFGILALLQLVSMILPIFFSLNLNTAIPRLYFDYHAGQLKEFVSTLFFVELIASSVVLVVLYVFHEHFISFIFPNISEGYYNLFIITFITVFFNTLAELFKIVMRTQEKARLFMLLSLILFVIYIVLSIVLIVCFQRGLRGMVEASVINAVASFFLYGIVNYRVLVITLKYDVFRKSWRFSLPLIPHTIAGLIVMYSDRIILEKYVSLAAIGLYAVADRIASIFKTAVNLFTVAYQPSFVKESLKDPEAAQVLSRDTSSICVFAVSFCISIIALFSLEIVRLFFDDRYLECWYMIPLLSSAYLFRCLYCFSSNHLFYRKKTGWIAMITLIAAIVNLVINLIWMPSHGVVVAIISTICAFFISFLLSFFMDYGWSKKGFNHTVVLVSTAYLFLSIVLGSYLNAYLVKANIVFTLYVLIAKVLFAFVGVVCAWYLKLLDFRALISVLSSKKN